MNKYQKAISKISKCDIADITFSCLGFRKIRIINKEITKSYSYRQLQAFKNYYERRKEKL